MRTTISRFSAVAIPAAVLLAGWWVPEETPSPIPQLGFDPELPVCDAGSDLLVECQGRRTKIQLDGSASFNPIPGALSFAWSSTAPKSRFDDPTSPTPVLTVLTDGSCSMELEVRLVVTNAVGSKSCGAMVRIQDTTPPKMFCAPDVSIVSFESTEPSNTGMPIARDTCSSGVTLSYVDDTSVPDLITRTWIADDGCQQTTCEQEIMIEEGFEFHMDIDPDSCPNFIFVGSGSGSFAGSGQTPVGLLGNGLNVGQVDLTTIRLGVANMSQSDPVPGTSLITPDATVFDDVSTPFIGPLCDCFVMGPDGVGDIEILFDTGEAISVFGLENEPDGAVVELELTGKLLNGVPFRAIDCIVVVQS